MMLGWLPPKSSFVNPLSKMIPGILNRYILTYDLHEAQEIQYEDILHWYARIYGDDLLHIQESVLLIRSSKNPDNMRKEFLEITGGGQWAKLFIAQIQWGLCRQQSKEPTELQIVNFLMGVK